VQEKMPFARIRQSSLAGLLKELRQVGRGRVFRRNRGRQEKTGQQERQDVHDRTQRREQGSGQ